jgi:hypothetical protein
MANSTYLTDHHLESVGVKIGTNYVIGGAMDDGRCGEFDRLWTSGLRTDPPGANYAKAESDFLAVATEFFNWHPKMGAMVLECTGFPPFRAGLATRDRHPGLQLGYVDGFRLLGGCHRDYYGHV